MMQVRGFTLIEMMISLVIGCFMLGGTSFIYISMKTSSQDTLDIGELQSSAQFAMEVLRQDIEQAGFFGTFYLNALTPATIKSPPVPENDCNEGSNGSFPTDATSAFRVIYSTSTQGENALNCINTATENSDVLQIKRVAGNNVTDQPIKDSHYYFIAQPTLAEFSLPPVSGAIMPLPHDNSTVWQYKHHVYFIELQTYQEHNKTITVPSLMRKRLTSDSGMITETVMEGVENMRFIYGLDTTADNQIDQYKIQKNMSAADWDQSTTQILTVQVFLLVRTLKQDNRAAKEVQYILGGTDSATQRKLTFNDSYRRTLLVSTIKLTNGSQAAWRL